MSTTAHQAIADTLDRAWLRHRTAVAHADTILQATQRAAQKQCGAGPGHIFSTHHGGVVCSSFCVVCGMPRREATEAYQPTSHEPGCLTT